MSSLLRELFDAVRRAPDHRAPAGERLRTITDAEIDAAIAASEPQCDDDNCTCGGEGLAYRPRTGT
ncbi:MAG: hypothetical protein ACTHK9_01130 [Nitrobacter sp.]